MPAFDPSQIDHVAIYPPIGIARVGNSLEVGENKGWFYGPEVPGRFDEPKDGFKDIKGAVKRQAARFRVYAFDKNDTVLGELTRQSGVDLDWSFEIANQKPAWYTFMGSLDQGAFQPGYTTLRNPDIQPDLPPHKRDKLVISPGLKQLSTSKPSPTPVTLEGSFQGSRETPVQVYLGEAHLDSEGHLVILGGRGLSRSVAKDDEPYPLIMTDFDSADWVDDTSDGWVNVHVTFRNENKTFEPKHKARVISTTPKFTAGIYAPTSLYDLIEDVYEREKRKEQGDRYDVGKVGWQQHIWPLLERPPLLSWVNIQADGGHGPNGPGNFYEKKWQDLLKSTSKEAEPTRRGVLGRMRLPATNEKYDEARRGQAFPYFMPWLSGDGGRTTAGDPSTFASVTELQYDRLKAWAEGKFYVSPASPVPPESLSDVPLPEQPYALTKAALEHTIGAPLYPGIEMSWNAEKSETYDLETPFTIKEDVQPGDLTKYLSLPWQSDFYMCRSYWWPSARPDSIVTEHTYEKTAKSFKPSDIAKNLNKRVPWERGLHQNYTDVYGDQPLFANTDMVQRWHKLGFIVERVRSSTTGPIFVETQRGDLKPEEKPVKRNQIVQESNFNVVIEPRSGGITLPTPVSVDQPIQTVESLRAHLRSAMAVELSTIPLYLFAMYSVKTPAQFINDPRYYDPIVGAVRGIVAEEMLHLSLAGNILLAVGGTPKLYDPDIVPTYPMSMLGRIPLLELNLRKMTKKHLNTFVQVEKPEKAHAKPEADKYHTLGQFYDAIKKGLEYLNKKEPNLFHPDKAPYQFAPGLGYQPHYRDTGNSVVVTDLNTARQAIKIIVDQGEGNPGPYDDPDHLEKDHFAIFEDLRDDPSKTWEVYNTRENPTTMGYFHEDRRIYHVSLAFDAVYCFLLLTIEKLWTIKSDDSRHKLVLGNMYSIMMGVRLAAVRFGPGSA